MLGLCSKHISFPSESHCFWILLKILMSVFNYNVKEKKYFFLTLQFKKVYTNHKCSHFVLKESYFWPELSGQKKRTKKDLASPNGTNLKPKCNNANQVSQC